MSQKQAIRNSAVAATALAGVTLLSACSIQQSRIQIIDYDDEGASSRFVEAFDEAYYDLDRYGNLDLVLRRADTSRGRSQTDLTQVIHVQSLWRSVPGVTVADKEQLNASISYALLGSAAGHTFEGAGSVFFDKPAKGSDLRGSIEYAVVRPARSISTIAPLFKRAQLSGKFTAKHKPGTVKRIKNDLARVFAPNPNS